MDVNGVSNSVSTTATATASKATSKTNEVKEVASKPEAAVVYEKSNQEVKKTAAKTYTPNTELVKKLQSDEQERANQLKSLVETMMTKQGATYGTANVFTSEFWKNFSQSGMTIDEAAVKQAQEDVSEDGYWGAKQTSARILDFAKALTGGDPSKIDEMQSAFEKGYKMATEAWGDELPSLSKDTYDAVQKGFDEWRNEVNAQ